MLRPVRRLGRPQIQAPEHSAATTVGMNTRVITVASQAGSNGEQIASLVAQEFGFGCLDHEVVERAARAAAVPSEIIRDAERSRPLPERALAAFANTGGWNAAAWYLGPAPAINPAYSPEGYRRTIDEVLRNLAREGHVVVMGHAGQMSLRDRWDTLRVLTVASERVRILRILDALSVTEAEAREIVHRFDAERKAYFQQTYREHWLSPKLYDLCLNTDHLKPTEAAHLICEAARQR